MVVDLENVLGDEQGGVLEIEHKGLIWLFMGGGGRGQGW